MSEEYLLIGYKQGRHIPHTKFANQQKGYIPGRLAKLAQGDAKAVIKAAVAAPMGVFLFEVEKNRKNE